MSRFQTRSIGASCVTLARSHPLSARGYVNYVLKVISEESLAFLQGLVIRAQGIWALHLLFWKFDQVACASVLDFPFLAKFVRLKFGCCRPLDRPKSASLLAFEWHPDKEEISSFHLYKLSFYETLTIVKVHSPRSSEHSCSQHPQHMAPRHSFPLPIPIISFSLPLKPILFLTPDHILCLISHFPYPITSLPNSEVLHRETECQVWTLQRNLLLTLFAPDKAKACLGSLWPNPCSSPHKPQSG